MGRAPDVAYQKRWGSRSLGLTIGKFSQRGEFLECSARID